MTPTPDPNEDRWPKNPIRDRYQNDYAFRTMVDTLWAMIERSEFTPTEIREAAMLAQILYEERRPVRPILFTVDDVKKGRI